MQHYLWKELLGFLVHPDIDTWAADLRVADVATGNGYSKSPTLEFDSSLDQVDTKPWLPANIHMHIWVDGSLLEVHVNVRSYSIASFVMG